MIAWMRRIGYDPGPLDDPGFSEIVNRRNNRDLINELVGGFARMVTEDDLFYGGAELGIPNAPVRSPGQTVEDEQLQFRGSFDALADPRPGHEGERPAMPCLPFRGNAGLQPPAPGAPPSPGEHTAEVVDEPGRPRPNGPNPRRRRAACPSTASASSTSAGTSRGPSWAARWATSARRSSRSGPGRWATRRGAWCPSAAA